MTTAHMWHIMYSQPGDIYTSTPRLRSPKPDGVDKLRWLIDTETASICCVITALVYMVKILFGIDTVHLPP